MRSQKAGKNSKAQKSYYLYHQKDNPTVISPHTWQTFLQYNPLSAAEMFAFIVYEPAEPAGISFEESEPAEYWKKKPAYESLYKQDSQEPER